MSDSNCCAFLFITERCNYRCSHCYVSAEPYKGMHMSMPVFANALTVLRRAGITDLRFTGGEPTVHPNFVAMVQQAQKNGFSVGVISNGSSLQRTFWTDEFQASLDRCWISLYGLTPQEHARVSQRVNGVGEFRQTINTVGKLSRHHSNIGLGVTVSLGVSHLLRPFLTVVSDAGVRKIRLLPVQRDGRAITEFPDAGSNKRELQRLMTEVQSWDEIKNFQSISINDMFNLEDRAESRMDSCLLHTRRMPAITPSGDIYRCCYNAYSEGALMGNLTDVEACAQALQAVEAPRHCRAFDVAEVNQSCKRCPISKVSVV